MHKKFSDMLGPSLKLGTWKKRPYCLFIASGERTSKSYTNNSDPMFWSKGEPCTSYLFEAFSQNLCNDSGLYWICLFGIWRAWNKQPSQAKYLLLKDLWSAFCFVLRLFSMQPLVGALSGWVCSILNCFYFPPSCLVYKIHPKCLDFSPVLTYPPSLVFLGKANFDRWWLDHPVVHSMLHTRNIS